MKKIYIILLSVFPLLISSCSLYNIGRVVSSGEVADKSFNQQVNYEDRKGLIVVKAKINGSKEEFEFIFDTGATLTVISKSAADKLGLKSVSSYKISDVNKTKSSMPLAFLDEIRIGDIKFKDVGVGIVDFPENSVVECIAKDGIIGGNIIRHCNWKIDFQNEQLTLTDDIQSTFELENSYIIPFSRKQNKPRINVNVNGVEFEKVLVDLGSNGNFDLSASVLKKHPKLFDNHQSIILYDGTTQGLWGNRLDTIPNYIVNSIGLANLTSDSLVIAIKSKSNPKIGNKFWAKYSMILDFENDNIILSPVTIEDQKKKLHGFGLTMKYFENGKLQVGSLIEPSPAFSSGLEIGDEILKINNKPVNDYFNDYCSFVFWQRQFFEDNDTLMLKVKDIPKNFSIIKDYYKN